jgi:hypothetical protein
MAIHFSFQHIFTTCSAPAIRRCECPMETQSSLPRLMPEDATRRTLSEPQAQSGDGSLLR